MRAIPSLYVKRPFLISTEWGGSFSTKEEVAFFKTLQKNLGIKIALDFFFKFN